MSRHQSDFSAKILTASDLLDGDVVYLTRLKWDIDRVERDYPDVSLTATKEMMV